MAADRREIAMTTYLLFDHYNCYPDGGSDDIRSVFQAEGDAAAIKRADAVFREIEAAPAGSDARSLGDSFQLVAVETDSLRTVAERSPYDATNFTGATAGSVAYGGVTAQHLYAGRSALDVE